MNHSEYLDKEGLAQYTNLLKTVCEQTSRKVQSIADPTNPSETDYPSEACLQTEASKRVNKGDFEMTTDHIDDIFDFLNI